MERRVAIEQALAHLPLMLTVEQTCEVVGIGRSLGYAQVHPYLATDGREGIPSVRIGTVLRIPRAGLVEMFMSTLRQPSVDVGPLHVVVRGATTSRGPRRTRARSTPLSPVELPFA